MGNDCFWSGSIPDPALQELAIQLLVLPFFVKRGKDGALGQLPEGAAIIQPEPGVHHPTYFPRSPSTSKLRRLALRREDSLGVMEDYPFDFYGYADCHLWDPYPLQQRCQFVFDRQQGGRMVTLIDRYRCAVSAEENRDRMDDVAAPAQAKYVVTDGGYTRMVGLGFTLMLQLMKDRYCPHMEFGDDYGLDRIVEERGRAYGLLPSHRDDDTPFDVVWEQFKEQDEIHHPRDYRVEEESPAPRKPGRPRLVKWREPTAEEAAIRLDDQELSVRALNCIRNAEWETIGDLIQVTPSEALRVKNFGRKTLNELIDLLEEYDLAFRDDGA